MFICNHGNLTYLCYEFINSVVLLTLKLKLIHFILMYTKLKQNYVNVFALGLLKLKVLLLILQKTKLKLCY